MSESKLKAKHILVSGDDEFAIKERGKVLVEALKPEDEMNLEVVAGDAENVDDACRKLEQAIESMLTLSFLGGSKLVHLRHCNFVADTVTSRSEEVKKRLEKLLEVAKDTAPHEARLVITAIGIDKRKAFYKKFQKLGLIELLDRPDINNPRSEAVWVKEVLKMLEREGLQAPHEVAERLVELLGNDKRALQMEIEKLALYAHPDSRITESDLRHIVSGNRELLIWDLCDAVTLGNSTEALLILKQLMRQGESEVGVLILLSRHIRLAALCMHLFETGKLRLEQNGRYTNVVITPEGEDLLPTTKKGAKPNPFRLQRITQQARHQPSKKWFAAVEKLYQTHKKMLTTGPDKQQLLESTILFICGK
ncbi:MAG: DNA polymerase III subunit delta [Verrucomicrobiota bacterium]